MSEQLGQIQPLSTQVPTALIQEGAVAQPDEPYYQERLDGHRTIQQLKERYGCDDIYFDDKGGLHLVYGSRNEATPEDIALFLEEQNKEDSDEDEGLRR